MRKYYSHIIFFFIVAILIAIALLTFRNLTAHKQDVMWIRHSNVILQNLQKALATLKEAEASLQAYQESHDTTFLQLYYESYARMPELFHLLDSLANHADPVLRMDSLHQLINQQFILSDPTLHNKGAPVHNNATEKTAVNEEDAHMKAIQILIQAVIDYETNIFNNRLDKESDSLNITPLAILVYTLLVIGGGILLFYRILYILKKREKAESDLAKINISLKKEMDMREASEKQLALDRILIKKAEKDLLEGELLSLTGRMVRTIAHEVRNPLTNLNLALEYLKDEMPGDNDSLNLYTAILQRNVNRIDQLIGVLLNASKPKELHLELFHINAILEETLAQAADRINLKHIKLEKDLGSDLTRVLVDKEKIITVLLNIIMNAIEAMTEGEGILSITTSQSEHIITVSIKDNGHGISPYEMENLFEPFFTAKSGGLGLGLTSAKNILRSHSAEIQVVSDIKNGTTFHILFKLAS